MLYLRDILRVTHSPRLGRRGVNTAAAQAALELSQEGVGDLP
jgi:hypothetical protein